MIVFSGGQESVWEYGIIDNRVHWVLVGFGMEQSCATNN